jgi:DNA-binding GntR family transcriptional regulator
MYTGPDTGIADVRSRGETVFAELKARLLAGELGVGRRLGEERLAEALGVSRTPVREALHRLHTEGLVVRHPDGGFGPSVPDVQVMRTLYEVRVGLEIQALRRPASLGTGHDTEALERLQGEWLTLRDDDPEPTPDFVMLDEAFHVALAAAAGNPVIVDFLRTVNERIRIVRMQDFLTSDRIAQTIEQHLDIVGAVLAGNTELAVTRFDNHLTESLVVVEERTLHAIAVMAMTESEER